MKLKKTSAIQEIIQEYNRATKKFGGFATAHEGYAVILEELDELWDEVKNSKYPSVERHQKDMRKEAVQVAAMAFRFIVDCC